ncbi:MAG: hypothetical protein JXQ23_03445, partial [Clostridia bacterium]|nr:hypothetical protein [Clostridia bacterium]
MLQNMIANAKLGHNVFITDIRNQFKKLENSQSILMELHLLEIGDRKFFEIFVPKVIEKGEQTSFVQSYINAEIYNILSSLGGIALSVYTDVKNEAVRDILEKVSDEFCINKAKADRNFYGNCINVIDRMITAIHGEGRKFEYSVNDDKFRPETAKSSSEEGKRSDMLRRVTENLEGKAICGIDIGGTDIKVALSDGNDICCFKEYDWNPKSFVLADQLIKPVVYLTKLVRAYYSMKYCQNVKASDKNALSVKIDQAMDKHADIELIYSVVDEAESVLGDEILLIDAIGLS